MRIGSLQLPVFAAVFTATSLLFAQAPAPTTPAPAQQPAPITRPQATPETPPLYKRDPASTITTTTRAVLLDVLVVDNKGLPVKGLPQSDFVITEDHAPQTIDSFHEHTSADIAQAANLVQQTKLPPNTFTNYVPTGNGNSATVILIDASNTNLQAQMFAREQIIAYMKTVPPGNPIAIFQMDDYMHLVQGFTIDPKVLLDAVQSKRNDVRMPSIYLHQPGYIGNTVRMQTMTEGLRAMGRYLAGFPGRKNLVWFTGSVPGAYFYDVSSRFPQIEDYQEELNTASETLALSRVSVYPVDARGLETDPRFSAVNKNMPSVNSFAPTHFYAHNDMDDLATSTGGKAFYNTNGLKEALKEVVETGSNYYTIAYTPTNKTWDGAFRKIHIELTPGLQGVHLQYRDGYYSRAPNVTRAQRAAARRNNMSTPPSQTAFTPALVSAGPRSNFDGAMVLGAIPPTEIIFNTSITPGSSLQKLDKSAWPQDNFLREDLRKKPFRIYHMQYTVSPRALHFTPQADGTRHGTVQFVAVLYDDKGEQVNSASSTMEMDLKPETYAKIMTGLLGTNQIIAVPEKGNYFLRLGVHDQDGNKIGATEVPIGEIQMGVAGAGQTLQP
jgi:VWFA-related protein